MKAIYSQPTTKAMLLNVNAPICTEPVIEVSTEGNNDSAEPAAANPLF